MTPRIKIVSLQRSLNHGFNMKLSNSLTLKEVKVGELSSPLAFSALLKKHGIDAVPDCPGTTPAEKQKYWNTHVAPLIQKAEVEIPRWQRGGEWWKDAD